MRRSSAPDLAALYPPHPLPGAEALWGGVAATIAREESALLPWLDRPPQTNEVVRSAVLMAGLLAITARTGQPLALFELGASAGLNLVLDRYAYRLGGRAAGTAGSALILAPAWEGPHPTGAEPVIVQRRGIDLDPLDPTSPDDRERLTAYIWADQAERIARVETALALAAVDPPIVEPGDAAAWIERQIGPDPMPGTTRVVLHSIAFQYFAPEAAARITAHLEKAGRAATADSPLAWLRYESDAEADGRPTLRLRSWPDGADHVLALADAHGRKVTWLA